MESEIGEAYLEELGADDPQAVFEPAWAGKGKGLLVAFRMTFSIIFLMTFLMKCRS